VASTGRWRGDRTVAAKSPDKIIREPIDPLAASNHFNAQTREATRIRAIANKGAMKLFDGFIERSSGCDCSLVEIIRFIGRKKGDVLALDAKFNFDDNALLSHPEIAAMQDVAEEDPREVEASKHELNYIGLDGNIACLVNGAGLAMATMDIIKFYGGSPANFLAWRLARPKSK